MILDIVCGVILVLFGLIGFFRGFARQVFSLLSGFVAIVGAFFLLMPVYNLLYELFLGSIIESIGSSLTFFSFLDTFAQSAGKTSGVLIMEYVFILLVYLVLVIVVGLLWKILKSIVHPICDLKGIKVFDKIFGVLLGFVWGALLIIAILYILYLIPGWSFASSFAPTITDLVASLSDGSFAIGPYVLENLDKVEVYFADLWDLIRKGFIA